MSDLEAALQHMASLRDNLRKTAQVKAAAAIPAELMPAEASPPPQAPPSDPSMQPGLLDPAAGGQPAPAPAPAPSEPPITRAELQQMLRQISVQQPAPAAAGAPGGGVAGKGGAKQEQEKRLASMEVALSKVLEHLGLASPEQAIQEGLQEHAQQAEAVLASSDPAAAAQGQPAAPQVIQQSGPAASFGPGGGRPSGIPASTKTASDENRARLARKLRGL